ncbi:hypothetical protein Tco_1511131 [Tanacetum coccineum]
MANLVDANQALEEILDKHGSRLYRLENQDIPNQVRKAVDEIVTDAVNWAMQAPLRSLWPEITVTSSCLTWLKQGKRRKRDRAHLKHHLGLHLILHRLLHHQQVPLELQEPLALLGRLNHHLLLHLHPTIRVASLQAPLPQAPQRQLLQLNIRLGRRPTPELSRLSHQFLKNFIWMTIQLQTNKHTHLVVKTLDMIPTVNLRQSWWKPLTEDRPATPEPAWSIPSSALTVPTNNWASELKSTYTPPPENSLLAQIGDMTTFID